MLLYERFEVPDTPFWDAQETAPVWDKVLDKRSFIYHGPMDVSTRGEDLARAERILSEFLAKSANRSSFELFTTPGKLWLIAPNEAEAFPLVNQLRAAGLLPSFKISKTPVPDSSLHSVADSARYVPPPRPEFRPEARPEATPELRPEVRPELSSEFTPAQKPPEPQTPKCSQCGTPTQRAGLICAKCAAASRRSGNHAIAYIAGAIAFLVLLAVVVAIFGMRQTPPRIAFNSSGTLVAKGGSVTLNWQIAGAKSVSIDQGIGAVEPSGSRAVTIDRQTTFELSASGPGGVSKQQLTVYVAAAGTAMERPVILQFTPDRSTIHQGESVRLSWTTDKANSVSLAPGPGIPKTSTLNTANIGLSDSITVPLNQVQTYTFTLTARGAGEPVTQSVTVNVLPAAPTATLTVNGENSATIDPGGTIHLCWKTANATAVHFKNSGPIGNSSRNVASDCAPDFAPDRSETYTLVASGPGGDSLPASANVTVLAPHTSGDIQWTGNIAPQPHHEANIFLMWNGTYRGGNWLQVVKSDGAFHGAIPFSKVTLSCTVDDGSQMTPMVISGDHLSVPVHIRLTFKSDGPHQATFHWEKTP